MLGVLRSRKNRFIVAGTYTGYMLSFMNSVDKSLIDLINILYHIIVNNIKEKWFFVIKDMDTLQFSPLNVIVYFIAAYMIGSIPVGLLISKIMRLTDPRQMGSGNVGATNILRTGSKKAAFFTFMGDLLKGYIPVLYVTQFDEIYTYYALFAVCLGVIVGHIFSIYLSFRGGKGVASFVGVLLALSLPAGLFFICSWLLVAWLTRYSSMSSIVAVGLSPVAIFYLDNSDNALVILTLSCVIILKHATNIKRLVNRTEPKIGSQ